MRKILFVSLALGLLLAIGTAYLSIKQVGQEYFSENDELATGLCNGLSREEDMLILQKIGIPLSVTAKTVQKIDNCTGNPEYQVKKTPVLAKYTRHWQFYVNWLSWSVPFIGTGYVIGQRRENYRH